ncbi:MAG: tetratricopeptide repeat protein [Planctomycetota bacterium]
MSSSPRERLGLVGALAAVAFVAGAAGAAGAAEAPLRGAVIRRLSPGGRSELARLGLGDIVTECDGKPVTSPADLKHILLAAAGKLTVKIKVYRAGRTEALEIIPGMPDMYCETHFRGHAAFMAGPHASPARNDHVRAGYEAFEAGRWRAAVRSFEAAGVGALPDKELLSHLTRARISSLQAEKAHAYAGKLLKLDERDKESIRLLFQACLLHGDHGQAARLARRMPEPAGSWAHIMDRERDAMLLTREAARARAYLAAGGDLNREADPLRGRNAVTVGVRDKGKEFKNGHMKAYTFNTNYTGGLDRLNDFIFSFIVKVNAWTWDWEERPIVAHVCDADNDALFNVGVDQWGRLLLGRKWYEVMGPCEVVRPADEENAFRIVRQGGRLDAFINGTRVARCFVDPAQKLRVYLACTNGYFELRDVKVTTPGAPVAGSTAEATGVSPGGDERPAERPAPTAPPAEVQVIITMLEEAVSKHTYATTRRNMEKGLKQTDMAGFHEELRAGIRVIRALEGRLDAVRRSAEELVGKEVELRMRAGPVKCKVKSASAEGITIVKQLRMGGRVAGEVTALVKWSDLAPAEIRRLSARWKAEGADGAVARALLARERGDSAALGSLAAAMADHPLGKHLGRLGGNVDGQPGDGD